MCNLSLSIAEKNLAIGEQKGIINAFVRIVAGKMESTKCSFEEAIKGLPISASEIEQVKVRLGID